MSVKVELRGMNDVLKRLNKALNPQIIFDSDIKKTTANSLRNLVKGSLTKKGSSNTFSWGKKTVTGKNLATGDTARAWTRPVKIQGGYSVSNKLKSGKYNRVRIISEGHREIRPKKGKVLYIPLTRKGQAKSPGKKPSGLTIGEDFIYVKKVKPKTGTKFVDKERRRASQELFSRIRKTIKDVYRI